MVSNLQCNNKLRGLLSCYNDNSFYMQLYYNDWYNKRSFVFCGPFVDAFEESDEKEIRVKTWKNM